MINSYRIRVPKRQLVLFFLLGLSVGAHGWIQGNSPLSEIIFKFSSGIGYFLLAIVLSSFFLLSLCNGRKMSPGYVANFLTERAVRGCAKTSCVMLGVSIVAITCWACVGSGYALEVAFLGFLLVVTFLYYWWVLHTMFAEACEKASKTY